MVALRSKFSSSLKTLPHNNIYIVDHSILNQSITGWPNWLDNHSNPIYIQSATSTPNKFTPLSLGPLDTAKYDSAFEDMVVSFNISERRSFTVKSELKALMQCSNNRSTMNIAGEVVFATSSQQLVRRLLQTKAKREYLDKILKIYDFKSLLPVRLINANGSWAEFEDVGGLVCTK